MLSVFTGGDRAARWCFRYLEILTRISEHKHEDTLLKQVQNNAVAPQHMLHSHRIHHVRSARHLWPVFASAVANIL